MKTHVDRSKHENLLKSYNFKIQRFSLSRVTTNSKICIDHVIASFPKENRFIRLNISDHYALEPNLPIQQCLRKNDCLYCPKGRNLNKLKGNHSLNSFLPPKHYLGLKPKLSPIDEDTTYILETKSVLRNLHLKNTESE